MPAKQKSPKGNTVYFANVALYVPRKGAIRSNWQLNEDYAGLVRKVLADAFNASSRDGLDDFKVKAVRQSANSKAWTLSVKHSSWEEPFKATVGDGQGCLQELFDYCLKNTFYAGESMHDNFTRDGSMYSHSGFFVNEGSVEYPSNSSFHFVGIAFHNDQKQKYGFFLDVDSDYVALMKRWTNHLGSVGNTTFTITYTVAKPLKSAPFAKGDKQYFLTVESPSWNGPKTIETQTGNATHGHMNELTSLCLQTVVKTGSKRDAMTIAEILESEHGVPQTSIDYRDGTYPYMTKFKARV